MSSPACMVKNACIIIQSLSNACLSDFEKDEGYTPCRRYLCISLKINRPSLYPSSLAICVLPRAFFDLITYNFFKGPDAIIVPGENCTKRYIFSRNNCIARYNFGCESCTALAKSVPGCETLLISFLFPWFTMSPPPF